MQVPGSRLAEMVGALSYATDSAAGLPLETAVRTCVTATAIGRELGLAGAAASEVYYSGLLRFVGCTAYAHETARYGAGDDLGLLTVLNLADARSPVDVLGRVLRASAMPLSSRLRTVTALATDPRIGQRLAAAHCGLAVTLATAMQMPAAVVTALGQMYERYDGRGSPAGLRGAEVSLPARILQVAWVCEAQRALAGPAAVGAVLAARRGGEFDPVVCDAAAGVLRSIVDDLDRSWWDEFLAVEPDPVRLLDSTGTRTVAAAFARYVDVKSPYTIGHSTGVAELARAAGALYGLAEPECERLRIAALLHDLGRVSVPNGIWDAPRPLSRPERERVRLAAYHTERILAQSHLLEPYAHLAGSAYERLDGSGYPRGRGGVQLEPAARLLAAADVYHALTEERPHRRAFDAPAAAGQLAEQAAAGRLDGAAVQAVLAAAGQPRRASARHPDGLTTREVEVLVLLARGLTNKSIARRLGISPRTVQNHVAHVFEKTSVSNRAAAAVYAVGHGIDSPGVGSAGRTRPG